MSDWEEPGKQHSGLCGNNCDDALDHLWEYLDSELPDVDAATVRTHLEECRGCLEEYDVDVVVKHLVRRGCQEVAPQALRLRIHAQLTTMHLSVTDS